MLDARQALRTITETLSTDALAREAVREALGVLHAAITHQRRDDEANRARTEVP